MTLSEVINKLINRRLQGIFTISIGKISFIHEEIRRCNVILKNISPTSGGYKTELRNIPIWYPRSGNSIIKMPVKVGDIVLVLFSKDNPGTALIDDEFRIDSQTRYFPASNAIVLGGFVLNIEQGTVIYGDEVFDIPEEGIHIVSDECVRILAPCIDIPTPVLQGSEEGVFSTSSNSYQEAFSFDFETGPWKYIVLYSFEVAQGAPGRASYVRIQLDDTIDISEGLYEVGTQYEYASHGGIYYMNLTSEGVGPNSHYIDFDVCRDAGGAALIRRMRVNIFKVIENVGCPTP